MSIVCPVAIRNAVFYIVWNLFIWVSAKIGPNMHPYSITGRVIALYVFIVSLSLPQCVDVKDFNIFIVFHAFILVFSACLWNFNFGSKMMLSILGFLFVCSILLSIYNDNFVLNSTGSCVKSVVVVFSEFIVN